MQPREKIESVDNLKKIAINLDEDDLKSSASLNQFKNELQKLTGTTLSVITYPTKFRTELEPSTLAEFLINNLLRAVRQSTKTEYLLEAINELFKAFPELVNYIPKDEENNHLRPSLLHYLVSVRNMTYPQVKEVAKLLTIFYNHDANFNILDSNRRTPGHLAVISSNFSLINYLYEYGLGLDRYDKNYSTVAKLAHGDEKEMIIELMTNMGASIITPYQHLQNRKLNREKLRAEASIEYQERKMGLEEMSASYGHSLNFERDILPGSKLSVEDLLAEKINDVNELKSDGFSATHRAILFSKDIKELAKCCSAGADLRVSTAKMESKTSINLLKEHPDLDLFMVDPIIKNTLQSQCDPSEISSILKKAEEIAAKRVQTSSVSKERDQVSVSVLIEKKKSDDKENALASDPLIREERNFYRLIATYSLPAKMRSMESNVMVKNQFKKLSVENLQHIADQFRKEGTDKYEHHIKWLENEILSRNSKLDANKMALK